MFIFTSSYGLFNDVVSTSEEQAEFGDRLLPFGPESFVFPLISEYVMTAVYRTIIFAFCFMWV